MIDDLEIQRWIARLECEESSWSNYEKLAILYTVKNQNAKEQTPIPAMWYSTAPAINTPEAVGEYGDSDFLKIVAGKSPDKAWAVIDDLMDTLSVVNKHVYNSVIQKLENI